MWWQKLSAKQKILLVLVWGLAIFFIWRSFLPFVAELNYRNAFYEESRGNYPQAAKFFEKTVKYFPWETYYRIQLGGIYEKIADQQKNQDSKLQYLKMAESEYEKCIQITDRNPWYHNRLGGVYLKYAQIFPSENVSWQQKHEDKILKAAELDQNNGIFQLQVGYLHYQRGDYDKAKKALLHIIEDIDERMVDPYLILVDVYRNQADIDNAQKLLEKIVSINPQVPDEKKKMDRVYLQLGMLYEQQKKYPQAITMYVDTLKVNRNSIDAARLLKRAAYFAKDKQYLKLAAKLLAVKFEPDRLDNYLLYFQLADVATEKQDIQKIMKLAKSYFPDNQDLIKFEKFLIK